MALNRVAPGNISARIGTSRASETAGMARRKKEGVDSTLSIGDLSQRCYCLTSKYLICEIISSMTDKLGPADSLHRDLATAVVTFHEAVAGRLGMSAAEQRVLGVLGRMDPATPGQLAEATGLTTGAITGIVDRLE